MADEVAEVNVLGMFIMMDIVSYVEDCQFYSKGSGEPLSGVYHGSI